jgi:hypothetical protein
MYVLPSKRLYCKLLKEPQEITQKNKWLEIFDIKDQWPAICKLSFLSTYETKLQSFQFSVLYRCVPYNKRLHVMNLVDSNVCDYCKEIDSLLHRFIECRVAKAFWAEFVHWWRNITGVIITLTGEDILFGLYSISLYSLNNSILVAKYYIHTQKCYKNPVIFEVYKRIMKHKISMEKYILTKNKKLNIFNDRWQMLENDLGINV